MQPDTAEMAQITWMPLCNCGRPCTTAMVSLGRAAHTLCCVHCSAAALGTCRHQTSADRLAARSTSPIDQQACLTAPGSAQWMPNAQCSGQDMPITQRAKCWLAAVLLGLHNSFTRQGSKCACCFLAVLRTVITTWHSLHGTTPQVQAHRVRHGPAPSVPLPQVWLGQDPTLPGAQTSNALQRLCR